MLEPIEISQVKKIVKKNLVYKTKKLTGTCGSVGANVSVAHGLTQSKIISVSSLVLDSDNNLNPPSRGDKVAYQYYECYTDATNVTISVGASATKTAGRPFRILITYEE